MKQLNHLHLSVLTLAAGTSASAKAGRHRKLRTCSGMFWNTIGDEVDVPMEGRLKPSVLTILSEKVVTPYSTFTKILF